MTFKYYFVSVFTIELKFALSFWFYVPLIFSLRVYNGLDQLVSQSVRWLIVGRSVGPLVGPLVGQSVVWSVGPSVRLLVDRSVGYIYFKLIFLCVYTMF